MSGLRRVFSDTFAFGRSSNVKAQSKVEKRLAECLPAADWPVYNDDGELKGFNGWHVFGSETARTHFIKHALILLSDNGKNDLCDLHFDNFFARSYDKAGVIWYTASIVVTALGDYRIRHSIVASRAGTTKTAAFQLLMLDVETKLDVVLRGNGVNSAGLPAKDVTHKQFSASVSIIATPLDAMAPPKLATGDYNTWSGAPLSTFPKSRVGTHSSHSSQDSGGTQKSLASSNHSATSQSSRSTGATVHSNPVSPKAAYQSFVANAGPTPKQIQHGRHMSTPLQSTGAVPTSTPKLPEYSSQPPPPPQSSSKFPTTTKALPALPPPSTSSSLYSSTEKLVLSSEPEQIHPALRSNSHSTEARKPASQSTEPPVPGSTVRISPVSPLDGTEEDFQPLRVEPSSSVNADVPSPLHFEKPVATKPARLLRQQTEFEIYV